MSLREAIETYHELLTDELAYESQEKLDDQQQMRGITFGGRPLCSVLRPRFMTPEQYRFLQTRVRLLLQAFDKIYYRALEDEMFRKHFGLLDWEEELIRHDSGFRAPSPTSRSIQTLPRSQRTRGTAPPIRRRTSMSLCRPIS